MPVLENIQHVIAKFHLTNPKTPNFIMASATDLFCHFGTLCERLHARLCLWIDVLIKL